MWQWPCLPFSVFSFIQPLVDVLKLLKLETEWVFFPIHKYFLSVEHLYTMYPQKNSEVFKNSYRLDGYQITQVS